ncbi:hypothetical protein GF312_15010 [Candidatus Poribacteria bacterium]|nr:hypothetical protein [Candidatus Poribacteria bacterium]
MKIFKWIIITTIIFVFVCQFNIIFAQDYKAKPGDIITVTVWERPSLSGSVPVDSNGNIVLAMPIGTLSVAGLTAEQITDLLTERLEEYMINPTVFASISPASGFFIHIIGEVRSPNFVKVPEGTRVQEAITRVGGFTPIANSSKIKLVRKQDDAVKEIYLDFNKFIETSDLSYNPVLKPDDLLVVPRLPESERNKYISIMGAVNSPGIYDLDRSLKLSAILARAGGISENAVIENISILKYNNGDYLWENVNFKKFFTERDMSYNPEILPGYTIFIPGENLQDLTFNVNVIGQVMNPGNYKLIKESRLIDAVYMAGGFTESAKTKEVKIISGDKTIKKVDVESYLTTGDNKYNPMLKEGDGIFVTAPDNLKKMLQTPKTFSNLIPVSVIGAVEKPDIYQVFPESSILDVLEIAGGPAPEADLDKVIIIRKEPEGYINKRFIELRKIFENEGKQEIVKINPGDTIFIPKSKPKRDLWKSVVNIAAGVYTITLAYLIVTGKR